jgi:hypothetical protein
MLDLSPGSVGRVFFVTKISFIHFLKMLSLTLGQTDETLILTLNEKRTLDSGYYLLVFTHQTTKDVVNKIYSFLDDNSSYTDRYNSFQINTNTVFTGQKTGLWRYNIYEQASAVNTDTTGLTEVETGILKLNPATSFAFDEYDQSQTFKVYNG